MSEPDEKDPRILLAAQIADGAAIDWTATGRPTGADAPQDPRFLESLRAVAAIARAHAAQSAPDDLHASIRGDRPEDSSGDPIQWGPLRVLDKIGRGSFGDVYRARDPRLDRDVALKLLRHRSHVPDGTEIVEEARLMARVRHPNVVTIYGAERIDGRTGIWMELLSQRNLAEEVTANGPMSPADAMRTVRELASGLGAIHAAGLLHRDVKPQNVLRNDSGRAVLTDFGTGHEHEEQDQTSPVAGTPLYVAPEILSGKPASVRADIYSLGVLLYYLVSGRHPVEGRSLEDIREAHRAGRYTPLASHRGIQRRLGVLVGRATAADPSLRLENAAEFEREIVALLQPSSRRSLAAAALVGVVVSIGAYAAWRATTPVAEGTRALVRARFAVAPFMRTGGVSPDGATIVCSTREEPLALCGLNDGSVRAIQVDGAAGLPDGAFAQFSPDGRRLIYMRRTQPTNPQGVSSLHIANIDGTGDRAVFTPRADQWFLRPGNWAARANVIVADLKHLNEDHEIVLLDPETGTTRVMRNFDRAHPVQTMAISADGRFITHDYQPGPDWKRDLVVIETATGRSWSLVEGDSDEIAPLWAHDGSQVFFSSDRSGTMGIWAQRVVEGRPIGEPEMLMDTGRDLYSANGIAGDGRILYMRRTGGFDGYRTALDLTGAAMSARRLSPRALDQIAAPDWSPDGSRLAYLASPSRLGAGIGASRVVVQNAATGREFDWVIDGQVHQTSMRWWPDGQSMLLRRRGEQFRVVVEQREAETGRVLRTFPPLSGAGGDIVPTPDGSALVYTSGGVVRELRLADMSDRVLMTIDKPSGFTQAAGISMTRDGDRVAVAVLNPDPADTEVMIVSRLTGIVTRLRFPVPAFPVGWVDGDRSMLAVSKEIASSERARVFAYDVATGSIRWLGLTAEQPRQFRLHPNGRELLFSAGQSRLELWWLENAGRE